MATSGFMKPNVCEVQQAPEGLGPAAGAGIEVHIVAFHQSEEILEFGCPIWDLPETGTESWQVKLSVAVVNGVKTVQKRGTKRCFHLTGRWFQGLILKIWGSSKSFLSELSISTLSLELLSSLINSLN